MKISKISSKFSLLKPTITKYLQPWLFPNSSGLAFSMYPIFCHQEVPVIFSEPHFLHASSELHDYARGLNPNSDEHETFIVLEPVTGAPLSGSKKIQLNMKITNMPTVIMLANVTDGYFPILWAEEVTPLQNLLESLSSIPLKNHLRITLI